MKNKMSIVSKLLGLIISLTSCAELSGFAPRPGVQSGGVGFTAGVATAKTIEKIKEDLTPIYKVGEIPPALCYRVEVTGESPLLHNYIVCYIAECVMNEDKPEEKCKVTFLEDEFWETVNRVELVGTSAYRYQYVREFCEKEPTRCQKYLAKFKDTIIMIEPVED